MDKLKAMATFTRIADEGSLTAAARAMDSSLPAVVRTLASLESHLGARLFNRTTRRLSLTAEGQRYLESCRQVLAAVADADAALSAGAARPSGLIRLAAPVQFGQMHVAPAVTRFVRQYPEVQVSMVLLDRLVNLLEEGMDLGVRIGVPEESSLVAQPVAWVRRVVVASPDFLRRHGGSPAHPRELSGAPCIRFSGLASPAWTFQEGGTDAKPFTVPVRGNLEFNQVGPVIDACAAGMGFAMAVSYQVAALVDSGALEIVLAAFEPPPRPVSLVYPHARLLPLRTRLLIDWLKDALADIPSGTTARPGPV